MLKPGDPIKLTERGARGFSRHHDGRCGCRKTNWATRRGVVARVGGDKRTIWVLWHGRVSLDSVPVGALMLDEEVSA